MGYSPWGRKESDTTERLHFTSKIIISGPITLWQTEGEKVEAVTDFTFLGSKITANSDCSREIKRRLPLGREAMINLESVLKSRAITLPTKICVVKAMVFPVAMYVQM